MKYLRIIALLVILLMIALTVFYSNSSNDCINKKDFEKENFRGVVTTKFFDQKNHNFMTIIIRNNKPIVLIRDTAFYSFIKRNDSIDKKSNTDIVVIHRDTSVYHFKLDFGCSDK